MIKHPLWELKKTLDYFIENNDIRLMALYYHLFCEYFINIILEEKGHYIKSFQGKIDKLNKLNMIKDQYELLNILNELRNILAHELIITQDNIDIVVKKYSIISSIKELKRGSISSLIKNISSFKQLQIGLIGAIYSLYRKTMIYTKNEQEEHILMSIDDKSGDVKFIFYRLTDEFTINL